VSEHFRGEAEVKVGGRSRILRVRLSARFEPLEGVLKWAGRAAPDEELTAAFRAGDREAELTIPGGAPTTAKLGEPDPWGGLRLSGTGFPPWPDFE
jgi:Domain of unknown function (DUF4873)